MSAFNSRTCECTNAQYSQIIHSSIAFQNSANTVYQAKNAQVIAATAGTLGSKATGNPIFKSSYERMQYLLGKQNQGNGGAGCGVPKRVFSLGSN